MNRALLIQFAVALVAGTQGEQLGIAMPLLIFATYIALVLRHLSSIVRAGTLAALALGALNAHLRAHPNVLSEQRHPATVLGTVIAQTGSDGMRSSFVIRSQDGSRMSVDASAQPPGIGSRVIVRGRIASFDPARNPGEPSPAALAAEHGLDARLIHARIHAINAPDPRDPHIWLPTMRAWASTQIRARIEEPYASILAGALWGERSALPADLRAEFQDTGTVHVLVTAGLHLGVVAALSNALLARIGVGRIGSSLVTIAVVWLYAIFSGAHLPSLRAATMASFALLARAAGREAFSWNALAAAAIVVSLGWPQSVGSISFALSFSCVAAIVLFAAPICRALERLGIPHAVSEALALTIATQVGTWPLTATAFLLFAPYAPLANALVVPTIGSVMLLGIAQLAATPVAPLAQGLANINEALLMWIVGVVRLIGSLPYAHIVVTPPAPWAIVFYDLALLASSRLLSLGRRLPAVGIFVCVCALIVWPAHSGRSDLSVTAIDVGQADALLIQTPLGHTLLVDAGGRLERQAPLDGNSSAQAVGERIVVPFLIRRGIHHLDAILLSHPHGDHAGGTAPVLRILGSDALADSGQSYPGHAYHDALDAARERHVPLLEPRGGDVWHTNDGVTIRFYGPTEPYLTGTRNDINNNSLVFRLEYGAFTMLFTGDAGAEAEEKILARGDDVRAEVLKVGHHGSAYSSTALFLRAVRPQIAIISVGRDNLFGHPAPATLSALQAVGARVYRTDEDGAIMLHSDGKNLSVQSFLHP